MVDYLALVGTPTRGKTFYRLQSSKSKSGRGQQWRTLTAESDQCHFHHHLHLLLILLLLCLLTGEQASFEIRSMLWSASW